MPVEVTFRGWAADDLRRERPISKQVRVDFIPRTGEYVQMDFGTMVGMFVVERVSYMIVRETRAILIDMKMAEP
jgi:hypothetical protein